MLRRPRRGAACAAAVGTAASGRPLCAKSSSQRSRVAVLDDRQLLEELLPIAIGLDRRERAIQVGGIAFVAVVLVP